MPIWPGAAWPSPAACWAKADPKLRRQNPRPEETPALQILAADMPGFSSESGLSMRISISIPLARASASREDCAGYLREFVIDVNQSQSLTYINMPYVRGQRLSACTGFCVRLNA
jgi:hypothetical protein